MHSYFWETQRDELLSEFVRPLIIHRKLKLISIGTCTQCDTGRQLFFVQLADELNTEDETLIEQALIKINEL
tara:strand:+ start:149 stop:364 length:216 start_codon:yes stop_codon:yes gene_type:complete